MSSQHNTQLPARPGHAIGNPAEAMFFILSAEIGRQVSIKKQNKIWFMNFSSRKLKKKTTS